MELENPLLRIEGSLTIEGVLRAASGQPLVVVASGTVVIQGMVIGDPGGPGADGGDVEIHAARLVLTSGGRIEAGPGGHGRSVIATDGPAAGEAGGRGGSIQLIAAGADLAGTIAPGRGGDGGHAYGTPARGGDGGNSGRATLNGEALSTVEVASQSTPATPLSEILQPTMRTHCTLPAAGLAALPGGGNGGDACSHGLDGNDAIDGLNGSDDDCRKCGTQNHPPCNSYTTAGGDNRNGERGQHGGSYLTFGGAYPAGPTDGWPAGAAGGRGGDSANSGIPAGNGGNAVATAGKGGNGGDGGRGGSAGASGDGCQGGNAGSGAMGADAEARGGDQGWNLVDCTKDGAVGLATATGGAKGVKGATGPGGGGLTNGRHGDPGAAGIDGNAGQGTLLPVARRPCTIPGAPTITIRGNLPYLGACVNYVDILPPVNLGGAPIDRYDVYVNGAYHGFVSVPAFPQPPPKMTYTHSPVQHGTTYVYEAVAHTAIGFGPKSAYQIRTADCPTLDALIFDPPGGLSFVAPTIGAPLLGAVMGTSSGEAVLTIAFNDPTTDSYNVYRDTNALSLVFVENILVPVGNPSSFSFSNFGLPTTPYHYQVEPIVDGVPGHPSNIAFAVSHLRIESGSGTGVVTEEYRSLPTAPPFVAHRCEGVLASFSFQQEGYSFDVDLQAEGPITAGPGSDAWCSTNPSNGTRHYTNRPDETRVGVCQVIATPAEFRASQTSWQADQTIECDGSVIESAYVNVTQNGDRFRLIHTISVMEDGWIRTWRFDGNLSTKPEGPPLGNPFGNPCTSPGERPLEKNTYCKFRRPEERDKNLVS